MKHSSPRSVFGFLARQPLFWLAVLLALALHLASIFGVNWLGRKWQAPAPISSFIVRTIAAAPRAAAPAQAAAAPPALAAPIEPPVPKSPKERVRNVRADKKAKLPIKTEVQEVVPTVEPSTAPSMAPSVQPSPGPSFAVSPAPAGSSAQNPDQADQMNSSLGGAMQAPPSTKFVYQGYGLFKGSEFNATGTLEWANNGAQYQMNFDISALFFGTLLRQSSVGRIGAQGLEPERFSEAKRKNSEKATHFEYEKGMITFSSNSPSAALTAGAQDRLSVVLQLGAQVASVGVPDKGQVFTLYTAGVDEAEPWKFNVEGVERLSLPIGQVQAIKLQRLPRKEFDQKIELWYSLPAYVPVRIQQTSPNGDVANLLLKAPHLVLPSAAPTPALTPSPQVNPSASVPLA